MQELISQKIKRTCQGCGATKEWELVEPSKDTLTEMQEWYTVIREIFIEGHGFEKMVVQACQLSCVPAAAVKLALPPQQDNEPPIDLSSLRVGLVN